MRLFIRLLGVGLAWNAIGRLPASLLSIIEAQDEVNQERDRVPLEARMHTGQK